MVHELDTERDFYVAWRQH